MPKVDVTIMADGSIRPDFLGFEGAACMEADAALRARLAQFGLTLTDVHITAKPELFATQRERLSVPQPQGYEREQEHE